MGRADADAALAWAITPRARDREGRQLPQPRDGHRDGIGLVTVPAGERAVAVVSGTLRTRECSGAEDGHCGAGAEVADRTLAVPRDRGFAEGVVAQNGGADPMSQGTDTPIVSAA